VKWDQRKTGRRVSHFVFTFGEKAREKPQKKSRKSQTQNAKQGSAPGGAIYGIPMSVIEKKARPGESYEDTALWLLEEARSRR
jgi:plasmid replication initiation protein